MPAPSAPHRLERRLVVAAAIALVVARTAVYLLWEQSAFDSDQAIFGLMAKHLVEGRALPVFMYGQNWILGVEAWLAAPFFLVAGPSVAMLKLPLLLINLVVGVLLVLLLEREAGLRPAAALVAALFFLLAPPGTSAELTEASGGNVEPFLYVLLLWMTRKRPFLFGAVFAIGFLHREFTAYGLLALTAMAAFDRSLFRRAVLRRALLAFAAAALVWIAVESLKAYSSAAGPGTDITGISGSSSNVTELSRRFCWNLPDTPHRLRVMWGEDLPRLFGVTDQRLSDFGVRSTARQGMPGLWLLVGGVLAFGAGRLAWLVLTRRITRTADLRFPAYLVLVGFGSAVAYGLLRCGDTSIFTMRYNLLALLLGVGMIAWYLRVEPSRRLALATSAGVLVWAAVSLWSTGGLLVEYLTHPPVAPYRRLVVILETNAIRYARSGYWTAYQATFLSQERVIIASDDSPRIAEYELTVDRQPAANVVRIERSPCAEGGAGWPVAGGAFYLCWPGR